MCRNHIRLRRKNQKKRQCIDGGNMTDEELQRFWRPITEKLVKLINILDAFVLVFALFMSALLITQC